MEDRKTFHEQMHNIPIEKPFISLEDAEKAKKGGYCSDQWLEYSEKLSEWRKSKGEENKERLALESWELWDRMSEKINHLEI